MSPPHTESAGGLIRALPDRSSVYRRPSRAIDPAQALREAATAVRHTKKPGRSDELNRQAFLLGPLVALDALRESDVVSVLLSAATDNGLLRDNGRADVLRTIKNGVRAGETRGPILNLPIRPSLRALTQVREKADQRNRERSRLEKMARGFCGAQWAKTLDAEGGPVTTYLRSRGLFRCSRVLRFHEAFPLCYPWSTTLSEGRSPRTSAAMVALVQDQLGEATGLHVTALPRSASPRPKLMFGVCANGAVRLSDFTDTLAVAEGIESALSYEQMFGIPCWAALSTSGLIGFRAPSGLKRLVIAADSDDEGAGLKAAERLADRVRRCCDEVTIHPAPEGQDWNDVLRAGGTHAR